jgi:protocatechuate 3,4-dioxygenase beta subunit
MRSRSKMRRRSHAIAAGGLALALTSTAGAAAQEERVVGLPCEGCEAVFVGLPETVPSTARIAPPGEPGEPLRIEGTVMDRSGMPAPGVIVYARHRAGPGRARL